LKPAVAARLAVLQAADAPVALVLRRGPTLQVCTVLWDRRRNRFRPGQWLKGRIDPHKCDLSPDGRYCIYFAVSGRRDPETKGTYTAVSRAPWLKALALYGLGDCWAGGGLFTGPRTYWLNDRGVAEHFQLRESLEVVRDFNFMKWQRGPEWPYAHRLAREGWTLLSRDVHIFEKPLHSGWRLRKSVSGSREKHHLIHPETARVLDFPDWEWADLDGRHLAWAARGRLYRAPLKGSGPGVPKLLHDFNPLTFEPRTAPY
jgi:hypothetical protein